jgi:vacuolar-type H+-ATPase subunit I/STV1
VVEMSQTTSLEDKIQRLESEIQKLKVELSIAIEFYAEVREFLSELMQLTRKSTELQISKPQSVLEGSRTQYIKSKDRLDSMLEHCIDLIFKDYKTQSEGG